LKNWKVIILFSAVLIFAFSSIVLSGFWKDKTTTRSAELSGNITLSREEIFEFAKLNDSLICSNSLTLEMIEARIAKHPNLKKVVVTKDKGVVKIEVAEKNPFAAASNGKDLFLVDDQLIMYNLKKEQTNIDLPVISGLSGELNTGTYGKEDLKNLKIAQYIIRQSIKINKSLFNYISEINFSDTNRIILFTSDDAVQLFFVHYNNLLKREKYQTLQMVRDINNESLRNEIDSKLVQLNAFLKQVRVYRPANSFKYIDMTYSDIIIIKNTDQATE